MIIRENGKIIAESALAFIYDKMVSVDYLKWLQLRVDEINHQFGELDADYHSFVVEQIIDDDRSIKVYIDRDMKADISVINALMFRLETPRIHSDPYPITFKINKNWQIFPANEKKKHHQKFPEKINLSFLQFRLLMCLKNSGL